MGEYEDVLRSLESMNVQVFPWDTLPGDVQNTVLAVAYAKEPTCPGHVWVRPAEDPELSLTVIRDVWQRYVADDAGRRDVFESFDAVNNRRVALVYLLGVVKAL